MQAIADAVLPPSLPVRGAWIEISNMVVKLSIRVSLPVRGAWIEMSALSEYRRVMLVAPRKGSVD